MELPSAPVELAPPTRPIGNRQPAIGNSRGAFAAVILIAAFLFFSLILPVGTVVRAAFTNADGSFTLAHMGGLFTTGVLREAFFNSLFVAAMAALGASVIALPLAYLTSRFSFRGAGLAYTLGVLPLVMPPFVGAVAMQTIWGKNGTVNLLLKEWLGVRVPFLEGLGGVIFVEALHYFPFILINVSTALASLDGAMEEAAMNLGAKGFRLFRRVVLPLVLPGYAAGALLVFVKVFDDLGTPLMLDEKLLLAPQAYLRITNVGVDDPLGYVISAALVALSLAALWLSQRVLRGRDYATAQRGGSGVARFPLRGWRAVAAYAWVILTLLVVLSPHLGLLLMSFAKVWSFTVLPDPWTAGHYATVLEDAPQLLSNTLFYCGIAAGADALLAAVIAYLMLRTNAPGRGLLDFLASASLAVPGVVLGIGYLRMFKGVDVPWTQTAVLSTWLAITLAFSVRRLPYALRSCVAALQQVHPSMEEAAQNLGASRPRALRRVVIPLMLGGIVAGGVTAFVTAAVELSVVIVLISSAAQAPVALGIYNYFQSATGRGPGAALGMIAVLIVALGTWLSQRLLRGRGALRE